MQAACSTANSLVAADVAYGRGEGPLVVMVVVMVVVMQALKTNER